IWIKQSARLLEKSSCLPWYRLLLTMRLLLRSVREIHHQQHDYGLIPIRWYLVSPMHDCRLLNKVSTWFMIEVLMQLFVIPAGLLSRSIGECSTFHSCFPASNIFPSMNAMKR